MSLYEEVTNRIIAELENGTIPWIKPWTTMIPYNAVSQREYTGMNILLLWNTAFTQSAWLTYKQAKDLAGHVKQGEKATSIVYASTFTKKTVGESGEETEQEIPFLKWYSVFNIDQCDRLPERLYHRIIQVHFHRMMEILLRLPPSVTATTPQCLSTMSPSGNYLGRMPTKMN